MASEKWEEYSVIGDKGEVGFIDFADDQSVTSYNPNEEGPVVVSVPFPFVSGKPQSVLVGETASDTITITNTTEEEMELWGMNIYASSPENSFRLSMMKPPPSEPDDVLPKDSDPYSLEDRILRPRQTLTVWLSCLPKEIGVYNSVVNIEVGDDRIERVVVLLAEDTISRALASDKPYTRRRKKNIPFATDSYVKGVRPGNTTKRNFKHRLPMYPISVEDRELFMGDQMPEPLMSGLTRNNYASFFRTLLIMEELQLEEDMKTYDMECVSMKRRGPQFLSLEVPGLAERRPSLVHGDAIFAKLVNADPENSVFEGYIHRVEADEIYLQFADNFHQLHSDDKLYDVHFAYNRVNFRRLYHAIEAAHAMRANYLFPSGFAGRRRIRPSRTVPISPVLNNEQCSAVGLILGCKGGAPYVIHGPPGTGKTKTLVEIILQLYRTRPKSRILVCASSNCAADHILEQMVSAEKKSVKLKDNEIFRLNAASRPYEEIAPDYMKFCFFEDLVFKCPPLEALRCYRIVVTTYMSASLLVAEGLKQGHFSHIILDEAGQASEPETMVPIANLSHNDSVIVLAGDPKQLGPVIQSKEAECYGLGKSYLERLFENDLYGNEDENYVTVLVRNYRCHPEILSLPSKMFYNDKLIASREVAAHFPWDDLLENKNFPVLFCGVQGLDEREGSNPSWFNRIEASKVVEIIKKLVEWNVDELDIGVITPYRQQVAKIKKAIEGLDMANIKIGSVEQFQGQEREVIIVSTVRSTIKHNNFDQTFCLGFLSNPKRFNVAMTRARSLLVIVGNPYIVSKDPCWEQLLWRCADNNSYRGCGLPEKMSYLSDMGPMTGDWGPDGNTPSKMGDWNVDDTASKMGDWGLHDTVGTGVGDEVPDTKETFTAGGRDPDKGEGSVKQSKEVAGSRGEWFPLGDLPEPVKDEDQWSDGWK